MGVQDCKLAVSESSEFDKLGKLDCKFDKIDKLECKLDELAKLE